LSASRVWKMSNGILQAFKAEALLADADILIRIERLRKNLQYTTAGEEVSFNDYLKTLRDAVDNIPKLELEPDVAPHTETQYSIQLVTSMEKIVDDCDRVARRLAHFQGRLRDAERQINNLKAEFVAWYLLAAGSLITKLEDIKLPSRELRMLADAEFSRLMVNLDLKVVSVLEDLKLEFERVSQHKATQKEKHNLGKDQANASWTSSLPSFGNALLENEPTDKLTREQDELDLDEEGVPAFVSRKPKIADVPDQELNKAKVGGTVATNTESVSPKVPCCDCWRSSGRPCDGVSLEDADCDCPCHSQYDYTKSPVGTFRKNITPLTPLSPIEDDDDEIN
jgi:hypothetical protein